MFQKKPWIMLAVFTALGFGVLQAVLFSRWGANVGLMAAAGVGVWCACGGAPGRRAVWWWLLPAACYAAAVALWEQPMLSPALLLGLALSLGLWALGGLRGRGVWALGKDFLPLGELGAVAEGLKGSARGGRLGRATLGVGLALPLLLMAGGLLLWADQAFYDFCAGWLNSLEDALPQGVMKVALSLMAGLYLCCLSLRAGREAGGETRPPKEGDPVVLGVMLGLYCGLYLLFLAVSCRTLPEMLRPGGAPEMYSGYARQGFFQLCAAAMLNLAVFLGARRYRCAGRGVTRAAQTLLAALTLCLIALALTKMLLYIRLYGLTLLRLYTSCMMAALALLFVALLVSLYHPLPMLRLGAVLAACALAVTGLMNAGGIVAETNVDRYLAGSLPEMDLTQYTDFPDAAAPALCRLLEASADEGLRQEILTLFEDALSTRESLSWWSDSLQRRQSAELMSQAVGR